MGSGLAFTAVGLRFSQQAVGTASAAQRVTLMNGTAADVTISSIKGSANFPQTHNCKATLAAGAFCYISVTFKPTSTGIKQGSITVTDNASGSPPRAPGFGNRRLSRQISTLGKLRIKHIAGVSARGREHSAPKIEKPGWLARLSFYETGGRSFRTGAQNVLSSPRLTSHRLR